MENTSILLVNTFFFLVRGKGKENARTTVVVRAFGGGAGGIRTLVQIKH